MNTRILSSGVILALVALVAFGAAGCEHDKAITFRVTFQNPPVTVASGSKTKLTAVAESKTSGLGNWTPGAPGNVRFSVDPANLASFDPAQTTSALGQGTAVTEFTAGVVDEFTTVTVTALYHGYLGNTAINIIPAPTVMTFAGLTGQTVSVTGEWKPIDANHPRYLYTVRPSDQYRELSHIAMVFEKPVAVYSSVGFPRSHNGSPFDTQWEIVNSGHVWNGTVITVTGDFARGGIVQWDILTPTSNATPPSVTHAKGQTRGPH